MSMGFGLCCCGPVDICEFDAGDWPSAINVPFSLTATATTPDETPAIGPCAFNSHTFSNQDIENSTDYLEGTLISEKMVLKLKENVTYRVDVDSQSFTYDLGSDGYRGEVRGEFYALTLSPVRTYSLQQWKNVRQFVTDTTTSCNETEAIDSGLSGDPGSFKTFGSYSTTLETEKTLNMTVVRSGDTHTVTPAVGLPTVITGQCDFELQIRVQLVALAATCDVVNHGDGRNLGTTATATLSGTLRIYED